MIGKLMKLESQNNMKLPNNVIKRTLDINSEKKKYGQIKMRDYMDRRITSPTFLFFVCMQLKLIFTRKVAKGCILGSCLASF